jgi:hypothetical protein
MPKVQPKLPKTRKEFVDFFKKIPDTKWCQHQMTDEKGRHCAVGHMNHYLREQLVESGVEKGSAKFDKAFDKLLVQMEKNFKKVYKVNRDTLMSVNDNCHTEFNSSKLKTRKIKTRVLAFLKQ